MLPIQIHWWQRDGCDSQFWLNFPEQNSYSFQIKIKICTLLILRNRRKGKGRASALSCTQKAINVCRKTSYANSFNFCIITVHIFIELDVDASISVPAPWFIMATKDSHDAAIIPNSKPKLNPLIIVQLKVRGKWRALIHLSNERKGGEKQLCE